MMGLAEKLFEKRKQSGLTMQEIANYAGISKTYLWELENKPKNPSAEIVKRLAKALSTSVAYLISDLPAIPEGSKETIAETIESMESRLTKLEKWIGRKL